MAVVSCVSFLFFIAWKKKKKETKSSLRRRRWRRRDSTDAPFVGRCRDYEKSTIFCWLSFLRVRVVVGNNSKSKETTTNVETPVGEKKALPDRKVESDQCSRRRRDVVTVFSFSHLEGDALNRIWILLGDWEGWSVVSTFPSGGLLLWTTMSFGLPTQEARTNDGEKRVGTQSEHSTAEQSKQLQRQKDDRCQSRTFPSF